MKVLFSKNYKVIKCCENKDINSYNIMYNWSVDEISRPITGAMSIIANTQNEALETTLYELKKQKFLDKIYLHEIIINQILQS